MVVVLSEVRVDIVAPHEDARFRELMHTHHYLGALPGTRLRRFAIGIIKARGLAVAETMRRLARNPRRVFDFLKMTGNAAPRPAPG